MPAESNERPIMSPIIKGNLSNLSKNSSSGTSTTVTTANMSVHTTTVKPSLEEQLHQIRLFDYQELILGRRLGQGTFADVYEVQSFRLQSSSRQNFDTPQQERRRFLSEQAQTQQTFYAVKSLREDFDSPKKLRKAAEDLEVEANLLVSIRHPHIIELYAKSIVTTQPSSKLTKDNTHDYFLVMDRLLCSLDDKITQWKREKLKMAASPLFARRQHSHSVQKRELLVERLGVAHDVAAALGYLHDQRMVYRDLKPDNVGFSVRGKVKVFDFGLSRRMPAASSSSSRNDASATYKMSGKTGSLPLMAPEVWKGEPYNEKADVYSFAVLLWMMLALDLPYLDYAHDLDNLKKKVMVKGVRPPIQSKWDKKIQSLLRKGWSVEIEERPSMKQVCAVLKQVMAETVVKKGKSPTSASSSSSPTSLRRSSFL